MRGGRRGGAGRQACGGGEARCWKGWNAGAEEDDLVALRTSVGMNACRVGEEIRVAAGEVVRLFVTILPGRESLSRGIDTALRRGQKCDFAGPLFFESSGRKIYRVLLSGS